MKPVVSNPNGHFFGKPSNFVQHPATIKMRKQYLTVKTNAMTREEFNDKIRNS